MIAAKSDKTNIEKFPQSELDILYDTLGVTETLKFLEQFDDGGYGDYTAEKV